MTGMDQLAESLNQAFGNSFNAEVFEQNEDEEALDVISGSANSSCLVLIGHSWGGDTAIETAERVRDRSVELLVQFDSVGLGDEKLPENVTKGINYFQKRTGRLEFEGENYVDGSDNYKVEAMYAVDDEVVTHTNIDNALFGRRQQEYNSIFNAQNDLHTVVGGPVAEACSLQPGPTPPD